MVVSIKFAVVNFPAVVFAAVVSAMVDTTDNVGGDLYPETDSLDDTGGFCVEFFVWFFSLPWKQTFSSKSRAACRYQLTKLTNN